VSPETFVKGQLAALTYREAFAAGGVSPMLAVACIIRNRVEKGWHGGDWMENVNHANRYAPFEPLPLIEDPEHGWIDPDSIFDLSNGVFRRVLQDVDDIYTGQFEDHLFSSNGLYYLDTGLLQSGRVIRGWFERKILGEPKIHPRLAQVGNLVIFA
jgi:hypothetical protein